MWRFALVATALLLCVACDHNVPVAPPPPPPPPPPDDNRPIAMINGPSSASEGQMVEFTPTGSRSTRGGPLMFIWDFGNGQTFSCGDCWPNIGAARYDDEGLYTVSLVVVDSGGAADTAYATITIINAPPVISDVRPPTQQAIGVPASMHVSFSDPGARDTHVLTVRWGDGASDSIPANTNHWEGDSLIHVYATTGAYRPRAIVRDNDGGVDSVTTSYPVIVFDPTERKLIGGYEVIDIGTLGGNSAIPRDINNVGQIVGTSRTAVSQQQAFLWEDGVMKNLDVRDGSSSQAHWINDDGLIAGEKFGWPGIGYDGDSWPVIWRNGMASILSGMAYSAEAAAVNTSGEVIWRAYGHESLSGWLWRNGSMQQLPGRDEVVPEDINDRGQIVGLLATRYWAGSRIYHAFLWEADSTRDLGVLGPLQCTNSSGDCSAATAMDINATGQIAGTSTDSGGQNHFVIWEAGKIRDLGLAPSVANTPDRPFLERAVINDRGQVAASAAGQGFFWSNGTRQSLGSLGGLVVVAGISDDGHVVGTSLTGSGEQHAFVWSQSGGMTDLGTGPDGLSAAWVVDVNSRGDILGYAAPCERDYSGGCGSPSQVRALLWRKR